MRAHPCTRDILRTQRESPCAVATSKEAATPVRTIGARHRQGPRQRPATRATEPRADNKRRMEQRDPTRSHHLLERLTVVARAAPCGMGHGGGESDDDGCPTANKWCEVGERDTNGCDGDGHSAGGVCEVSRPPKAIRHGCTSIPANGQCEQSQRRERTAQRRNGATAQRRNDDGATAQRRNGDGATAPRRNGAVCQRAVQTLRVHEHPCQRAVRRRRRLAPTEGEPLRAPTEGDPEGRSADV